MNRHGNLLTYIAFAIVGVILTYNTDFSAKKVQASPVKTLELPPLKFDPNKNLNLEIDLNNGISNVKSDMPITKVDVTVNHPTKIVEKVVKQPSKERIVYETKVQYVEKPVMFTLPAPRFHVPHIEIPMRVE